MAAAAGTVIYIRERERERERENSENLVQPTVSVRPSVRLSASLSVSSPSLWTRKNECDFIVRMLELTNYDGM